MDDVPLVPLPFDHICFILFHLPLCPYPLSQPLDPAVATSTSKTQNETKTDCIIILITIVRRSSSHSCRRCARDPLTHKWPNSKMRIGKMWCLCALCGVDGQFQIITKICMRWENRSIIPFIFPSRFLCHSFHLPFCLLVLIRCLSASQRNQTNTDHRMSRLDNICSGGESNVFSLNEIYYSIGYVSAFSVVIVCYVWRWRKYGTDNAVKSFLFICSIVLRLVFVETSIHNKFTPAAAVAS